MTPGASLPTETDEKWPLRMRRAWGFAFSSLIWLTSRTQLAGIVHSNHCQGSICVICQHIDLNPQLKTSSVTSLRRCQVRLNPTFWRLSPSINIICLGQYLGFWAPPRFHLPSPSWQTSINGARWGDNEAPSRGLSEVGEWQRHIELSLSQRNKRRGQGTGDRREATSQTEFGKPIPLCLA